jgi:competence protein ComEA
MWSHTTQLALLAGLLVPLASAQDKQKLPDGAGKEVVQRVCNTCHGAEIVLGRGLTRDGWTQVVGDMVQRGAQGSEDDFAQIVDYLATNFPPKSDTESKSDSAGSTDAARKVNVNKATADELKTGLDLTAKQADSIVSYRGQNGDFKSIDDVKKVPGLDAAKIDAVKDRLTF